MECDIETPGTLAYPARLPLVNASSHERASPDTCRGLVSDRSRQHVNYKLGINEVVKQLLQEQL